MPHPTVTALSPATITFLEQVAVDNGFDRELPRQDDWLGFASSETPLRVWLSATEPAFLHAAVSQDSVLDSDGLVVPIPLPEGARSAVTAGDVASLYRLVQRAFRLSKALPDGLLRTFQRETASLPRTTEAERLVIQRIGQGLYRQGLLDYWEARCAITGLHVTDLLRASHIKPWGDCASDAERLDIYNGLLLAPHLDAAFDRGFITVADSGEVLVSALLIEENRRILGLDKPLRVKGLTRAHRRYLPWHRRKVFRRTAAKK